VGRRGGERAAGSSAGMMAAPRAGTCSPAGHADRGDGPACALRGRQVADRRRAERGEAGRQAAAEATPQKPTVQMWNVVVTTDGQTAGRLAGDGLREKLA